MIYRFSEKQYYIPCGEEAINKLAWWIDGGEEAGRFCIFGNPEDEVQDTVYLIAHGTPEGYIKMLDTIYYPEAILRGLILDKVIDSSIKHVYTLSCYGGKQEPATVDGVVISSLHTSMQKILIQDLIGVDTTTGKAIAFTLDYEE
jgi:hypothetical protein